MAAAGAGRGDAKNGGAVGFRGAGVVGGAPGRGRPRIRPEIVPARVSPLRVNPGLAARRRRPITLEIGAGHAVAGGGR